MPKITVDRVVTMTMNLSIVMVFPLEPQPQTRPTVIARPNRSVILLAAWAACSLAVTCSLAADAFDPASVPPVFTDAGDELPPTATISDRIVLAPDETVGDGSTESILAAEEPVEVVAPRIMESVVDTGGEPRMLEVSSQAFDGMLMEDFSVDEMPFEASSGRWFWNGGWYLGGESLWMERSRNNRTVIVEDYSRRPLNPGCYPGEQRVDPPPAITACSSAPGTACRDRRRVPLTWSTWKAAALK